MKLSVTLLSLVALVTAGPHRLVTRSLDGDLREFFDYYSSEEIWEIISSYLTCDEEFDAFVKFIQSENFGEFIVGLQALPEFNEFFEFFKDEISGDSSVEAREAALDLESSRSKRSAVFAFLDCDRRMSGGLKGFFRDLFSALPKEELKALLHKKLQTSPEFRAFFAKLQSEELKSIIQRLKANPDFQQLLSKTKFDIEGLINSAQSAFGLQFY